MSQTSEMQRNPDNDDNNNNNNNNNSNNNNNNNGERRGITSVGRENEDHGPR